MASINNIVWREESLQTEVSPTGGLTSTCHLHVVRDQSVSVCSKTTCQKLNHRGREEKWSIPQTVCSAVIKHCSLNTYTFFAIAISWSRSKFAVKPHDDIQKKRYPKCIRKWIRSIGNVQVPRTVIKKSFKVFKLTVVEKKQTRCFLTYRIAFQSFQPSVHCLFHFWLSWRTELANGTLKCSKYVSKTQHWLLELKTT